MTDLDFSRFSHLSFDCYGTIIDWESGILSAVIPALRRHFIDFDEVEVLRRYAHHESTLEAGPYRSYRDIQRGVMRGLANDLGFSPTRIDLELLPDSIGRWQPFADSVEALQRLQRRYGLVILSNIDDAMFVETAKLLPVELAEVVTAEQVGRYKPARDGFEMVLDRLGVPREQVLHVAQSLYHDHVPAQALGFSTVWVNRDSRCPGTGVALPVDVTPDLEVPDLRALADRMRL